MIRVRSITFSMLTIASCMLISTAAFAERTIALRIVNTEEVPVTFTITGVDCYEPYKEGLSGTIKTLKPDENYLWKFNRIQGNGCDGKDGYFNVEFDPAPENNTSTIIQFSYDNGTNLVTVPTQVNPYPGRLEALTPAWYNYHTSGLMKKVKAGRAVGEWKSICIEVCNNEKIRTISKENSQRQGLDTEETSAISVSLTTGVEMGSFSAESNITSSYEKRVGRSMEASFTSGETNTDLTRYIYTPDQMNEYNFHAIWQWVVPMTLSTGKSYLVRSKNITCTKGHLPPPYAPGDDRAVGSCSGALAKEKAK